MTKTVLRNKLVKAISGVQDEELLKAMFNFLNTQLQSNEYELSDEDKADLDERMVRDKAGLEKGSSWEEVKARVKRNRKVN